MEYQNTEMEKEMGVTKQLKNVIRRSSLLVKGKNDVKNHDIRKGSLGGPKKPGWFHLDHLRGKPRVFIARSIFARMAFFSHCATATLIFTHITESAFKYYILFGLYCVVALVELAAAIVTGHLSQWKWCCTSTLVYSFYMIALVITTEVDLYQLRLQHGVQFCTDNYASCAENDDMSFTTNSTYSYNVIATASRGNHQSLVFLLILGRWLLPKDTFSREALAQLLLVLIGSGEDIVEFVSETMVISSIGCSGITMAILLLLWSMSLQQFSVALPQRKDKGDFEFDPEKKAIDKWIGAVNRLLESRRSTVGNLSLHMETVVSKKMKRDRANSLEDKLSLKHLLFRSTEVREALVTVLLQDGPFLLFRLYVISLSHYIVSFYACKNLLVVLLHGYRIYAMMVGLRSKGARWSNKTVAPLRDLPLPSADKANNDGDGVEISRVRAFSIIDNDDFSTEEENAIHELVLKESAPKPIISKERKNSSVRCEGFSNPIDDSDIKENE